MTPFRRRVWAARPLALGYLALAASGCAQVLGIPSDPQLAAPADAVPPAEDAGPAGGATPPRSEDPTAVVGGVRSDASPAELGREGMTPADAGLSGSPRPPSVPASDVERLPDAGGGPPVCPAEPQRRPLDILFAVDNSGSMAEECAAFEAALPSFVQRLASAGVDYSIILVSRHRRDERGTSEEADTSLCITSPVSALEACPSERPALGARFFQHSIKLDSADSFERLLESAREPDPFELNTAGWSEWLRPGAPSVLIEITDGDSDMTASEFVGALRAAVPGRFGDGELVFHSVLGIARSPGDAAVHGPDEPDVLESCSGPGSSIDGVGAEYQALSRATGGLRLSICPPEALGASLAVLAEDVIARSAVACP